MTASIIKKKIAQHDTYVAIAEEIWGTYKSCQEQDLESLHVS